MSTYSVTPTLSIPHHMRELGLGALTHATWHATTMSFENPYWPELSVLQAAHAAEILIKAIIAQTDHLLIFENIPKSFDKNNTSLSLLYETGRTYQYHKLPEILFKHTGIEIEKPEAYRAFGRLRNAIQHFSPPPDTDFGLESIRFIFEVIEPLINKSWGLFAIDYNEESDEIQYLVEYLISNQVLFLVSPFMVGNRRYVDISWDGANPQYQEEMNRRLGIAGWFEPEENETSK